MMEIVIKIPDVEYKNMAKVANAGKEPLGYFERVIMRGTPLPKGHGRLKDVDKLESHDEYDGQGFTKSVYKDDIDSLPTIIFADKEVNADEA